MYWLFIRISVQQNSFQTDRPTERRTLSRIELLSHYALYKFGYQLIFKITFSLCFLSLRRAIIFLNYTLRDIIALSKNLRYMHLFFKLDRFWLKMFVQFSVSCKNIMKVVIQLLSTWGMHSQERKHQEKNWYYKPFENFLKFFWVLMDHLEPFLTLLNLLEPSWTSLNLLEPSWTSLNLLEPSWSFLKLIESLNILEPPWTFLSLFEPSWTFMILLETYWTFEPSWTFLNLYDPS